MKTIFIKNTLIVLFIGLILKSCGNDTEHQNVSNDHHDHHDHAETVHLTQLQFETMNFKVDSLPRRNLSSYVNATGQIEVPPQNKAEVTAVIGANVKSIHVIEGEEVKKGQVLAYLSHPDIIKLQTEYISNWNELQFIEQEYERQQKLYSEEVGSGKTFQKIQSDFNALSGVVKGLEVQLRLIGISVSDLQKNEIAEAVALRSPLNGYIQMVEIKVGQYVSPTTPMFEIVNVDHVHADLMVFEKDIHKIRKGQKVLISVQSLPEKELSAEIYAVGKTFESDPKAIHLHTEIENKEGVLIPGMYVNGRILIDNVVTTAIPEEGLVREGDKYFIFTAEVVEHHGKQEWIFTPVEVSVGEKDRGWVEIEPKDTLPESKYVSLNNAYQLLAEMKKEEAEHSH